MKRTLSLISVLAPLALAACTVVPAGPMMLLPGPGKSQDAFRQDDAECRAGITPPADADVAAQQAAEAAYSQCMVARGNVLQPVPVSYTDAPYPYGYAGPAPYPYSPYWGGAYGAAWLGGPIIIGGWGGYWGGGWNRWHRWHHRPPPGGWGGGHPPPGGWGGGGRPPGGGGGGPPPGGGGGGRPPGHGRGSLDGGGNR